MAKTNTIALVGSETLLGRELRDVISERRLPVNVRLVGAGDEESGRLTEVAGEAAVILRLEEHTLAGARAVLLAASPELSRDALALAGDAPVIDLTHAAEDDPRARLRAPMVEPDGYELPPGTVYVIAHPAAIAVALLLKRIQEVYPVRRSMVHIFEPASERGSQGLEELQHQTSNLLSFQTLPKEVFDAQLSFNLLARYGEEAPLALEVVELRIERDLATLLALPETATPPMPSLRLIQAPVFHGHSFSVWVELDTAPGVAGVERAIAGEDADVRESGTEPPNIVQIAGQSGISVGAISQDRNVPQAYWIWMAADNLRLAAENAVKVLERLL